ncbi:hypothetical protein BEN74_05390 [Acinetobacter sp. WCHAc010034]|nr:hypothetical protein BEN74_05390 [Acinetobacter sp. WCHAc010034]
METFKQAAERNSKKRLKMLKKSQAKAVSTCMKAAVRKMRAICVFWPVLCFAVRLPGFLFMRQMAQIWSK